jgi:hypothetical protein
MAVRLDDPFTPRSVLSWSVLVARSAPSRPSRSSAICAIAFFLLALIGLAYGLLFLVAPPGQGLEYGIGLIAVGAVSMVLAFRGVIRRKPGSRKAARGPTFTDDDPEVADLPPTTTTHLSERVKRARERQQRAQYWEEDARQCWEEDV